MAAIIAKQGERVSTVTIQGRKRVLCLEYPAKSVLEAGDQNEDQGFYNPCCAFHDERDHCSGFLFNVKAVAILYINHNIVYHCASSHVNMLCFVDTSSRYLV